VQKKLYTSQQPYDAPSTDVAPERFPPILTARFVMSEATSCWKGPRYLAYDTYDARLRSFFTWPKHMHPSPQPVSFMLLRIIFSPTPFNIFSR